MYLLLGPLIVCATVCVQLRGCSLRLGAARHDPLDVSRGLAAVHLLLTLLLKPPFPENVAWWLTILPCMFAMGHVARLLLLVPRALQRSAAPRYAPQTTMRGRAAYAPRGTRARGGPML